MLILLNNREKKLTLGYSGKNQVIYSPDYGSKSPIKMYVVDS
jgi:epoxyqueuosine reductase QueG